MGKRLDLINLKFGKLIVKKFSSIDPKNGSLWLVQCDCGSKPFVTIGGNLVHGNTKSCGCTRTINVLKANKIAHTIHGFTSNSASKLEQAFHHVWRNMLQRCYNQKHTFYTYYGGRGIKVCDRWLTFENFRDDMWVSYLKHVSKFGAGNTSIERIDVNSNYELLNCTWATKREQVRSRRNFSKTENYEEHAKWRNSLAIFIREMLFPLKRNYRSFSANRCEEILGCTQEQFKQHIFSQFSGNMSWDNHGNGCNQWNIDHIIPINQFDLSKEEDRKKCFHYTNLRPMGRIENNLRRIVSNSPK